MFKESKPHPDVTDDADTLPADTDLAAMLGSLTADEAGVTLADLESQAPTFEAPR